MSIIKRNICRGIVAIIFLMSFNNAALANHYVYLGEDSTKQGTFPGEENFVNYWWAEVRGTIHWWGDPQLWFDASTAAANWQTAVSMPLANAAVEADADVAIRVDYSLPAYGMMSVSAVYVDSTRNANYILKSDIYLNTLYYPNGGFKTTIAHELGHVMGLHERYIDDGSTSNICNLSESTIMNSGSCINRPFGPSTLDADRVKAMYNTGQMLNLSSTGGNDVYTITWNDGSWGEYEHRLYFYWWDNRYWRWVLDIETPHTINSGMRQTSWSTRTLSHTFYWPTTYGGVYKACGWTRHYYGSGSGTSGGFGSWSCAPSQWIW